MENVMNEALIAICSKSINTARKNNFKIKNIH